MTNTKFNNEEFLTIDWSDVQHGDILMNPENGDRLTVRRVDGVWVAVPGSQHNRHYWEERGFTPHRPVPSLDAVPTEPGAYHDKDGVLCVLHTNDDGYLWFTVDFEGFTADMMRHRAPFTRLVPMPTEERIKEQLAWVAAREFHSGRALGTHPVAVANAATAVMSLMSGEANSTEMES